jgi:trehalose/maltose transport system substrate-binding protein
MPGGVAGSAGTLGGSGLAVAQHSPHVPEAIRLVQFLIRAQIQSNLAEDRAFVDTPQVPVDSGSSGSGKPGQNTSGVVNRPSSVVGNKYEDVSRAYISAVHSVLTGEKGAPEAAADLEKELARMTGFKTGPPRATE